MSYRNPRTQLVTHEVTNQPSPLEDVNLYASDAMLTSACARSGAMLYAGRLSGLARASVRRRRKPCAPSGIGWFPHSCLTIVLARLGSSTTEM